MDIWVVVHQINSLEEVLKLKQNFQKNKVITGKTPFFVIGPFCTHHSIFLNIDWLLIMQFCMEMIRFESLSFQVKNSTPVI